MSRRTRRSRRRRKMRRWRGRTGISIDGRGRER